MIIHIETIPHERQRYSTCGDYFDDHGIQIRVSEMSMASMIAVIVHELIEALLCMYRRIPFDEIDQWDMRFKGEGEPGDDPFAPYYDEHEFATLIERLMLRELGSITWQEHEENIAALDEKKNAD
jgi:hypothetical protein